MIPETAEHGIWDPRTAQDTKALIFFACASACVAMGVVAAIAWSLGLI